MMIILFASISLIYASYKFLASTGLLRAGKVWFSLKVN